MSDIGGGEPSATGMPSMGMGVNLNLPALTTAASQIGAVSDALSGLKNALRDLGSNSYMLTQGINSMFTNISKRANETATALNAVSSAVAGVGGGSNMGTSGGQPAAPAGANGSASWVNRAVSSIATVGAPQSTLGGTMANNITGPSGGGGGGGGGGIFSSVPLIGGALTQAADLANTAALFPFRFLRDQISANRQTVLSSGAALGRAGFASNASISTILGQLARMPGAVQGPTTDILDLFSNASQYGAFYDFGGAGNAPRTGGFLRGVREAQMMNPGASLGSIAQTIGGQASNIGAQQASVMLTGGAMGMIKMGGGQKSLSEWADDVLKWLQGLRGGANKGKAFSYGELVAQYYPGSNIDAWFTATGVSPDMREYWWSYALNKAKTGTTEHMEITPQQDNPLWQRLQATTSAAGAQFGLGATMSGAYANKESANRFFNDIFGKFLQTTVPAAVSTGKFGFAQFMPDTMEQMMMSILERSGIFGTLAAGGMDLVSLLTGGNAGFNNGTFRIGGSPNDTGTFHGIDLPGGWFDIGWGGQPSSGGGWHIGDVGDGYTTTGGTGVAGLHPDMQRKLKAMMRANPRIKVTSGLRDNRMQQTLKRKGVGRVSGKPSAHTRGMAADLGPSSEYGWIVNNARKFGLSSGVGMGEPWHVGMGDTDGGGIGDITDLFSDFFRMFSSSPSDAMSGVAGTTGSLLGFLNSVLGGTNIDPTKLAFIPNVYEQMMAAAGGRFSQGGITSGGATTGSTGGGGGGGGGGWQAGFSSNDDATRAASTAAVAYQAGFRGDALDKIVKIAYRESRWKPTAHRYSPHTESQRVKFQGDRGLFQLNYVNDPMFVREGIISSDTPAGRQALFDPLVNARGAYALTHGGTDFSGWGYTAGVGWDPHGDPLHGTQAGWAAAQQGEALARQAGWIGDVETNYPARVAGSGGGIMFSNTFVIGGSGTGGGGGGIDARRTATLIADHLEDEMDRRLARRS